MARQQPRAGLLGSFALIEAHCSQCGGSDLDDEAPWCKVCQTAEFVVVPPRPPAFYSVAVYLQQRAYGGPEEGGWYYDQFELERPDGDAIPLPQILPTLAAARAAADAVQEKLNAAANVGRPPVGSVLSAGILRAMVCPEYPVPFYPPDRPHYE